jgi:hypothetical protein
MPVKTASAFMTGEASFSIFLSCHRLSALYPIWFQTSPTSIHPPREADSWLGPSVALIVCPQPADFRPFVCPRGIIIVTLSPHPD